MVGEFRKLQTSGRGAVPSVLLDPFDLDEDQRNIVVFCHQVKRGKDIEKDIPS